MHKVLARGQEGRRSMQSNSVHTVMNNGLTRRPAEDVVYKVVTLAAILLVLGSLWVF